MSEILEQVPTQESVNQEELLTPIPAKKKPGRKKQPAQLSAAEQELMALRAEIAALKAQKEEVALVESPLQKTLASVEAIEKPKSAKELFEEKMHKMWEEDNVKIKGVFRNHEAPGVAVPFKLKIYKWDHLEETTLKDGEIYEIPRKLVRHINENCSVPLYKEIVDAEGKPRTIVGAKQQRYSFAPLTY